MIHFWEQKLPNKHIANKIGVANFFSQKKFALFF